MSQKISTVFFSALQIARPAKPGRAPDTQAERLSKALASLAGKVSPEHEIGMTDSEYTRARILHARAILSTVCDAVVFGASTEDLAAIRIGGQPLCDAMPIRAQDAAGLAGMVAEWTSDRWLNADGTRYSNKLGQDMARTAIMAFGVEPKPAKTGRRAA